jgi:UDP-glucose 4-epimerase
VCKFAELDPYEIGSESHSAQLAELVVGDIKDFEACLKCCEGVDVIVHLAASTGVPISVEDPRVDMESNVIGTFNMLEAARQTGVQRFVFASSGAPVGEVEPPIHEELAPHPVSPYGASKLAGEGYCSAYYRTFGLETVALRIGNVYGPGSGHKNSVVAKFIKQAMSGEALEIYGDGKQTRDFIYIGDLIRAIFHSATVSKAPGEIYQIATNREHTVNELVEIMIPVLKSRGINAVKVVHGEFRLGDVRRNYSDTSKARQRLGWRAEVNFVEGIRRTISWYHKNFLENEM